MQDQISNLTHWPYLPTLSRLLLATALGVFVGLERERRGKEAGIRTFGFSALLGCVGSLISPAYGLAAMGSLLVVVFFLNWQRMRNNSTTELTTSVALMLTGFTGVLCGLGHTFTPVAVGLGTALLLAWKEALTGFSVGLTEEEIRSALLLGIIAFVVYPVLPQSPLDPWGLVEPRTAWATVILIASVGFVNYILWKWLGSRGLTVSGFLGGLVNSNVAVAELAARVRDVGEPLTAIAAQGIVVANVAMLLRNAALVGILAPHALPYIAVPLAVMAVASLVALLRVYRADRTDQDAPKIELKSPFSLVTAVKFGLVFVALDASGTLAQRHLGAFGFYAVSIAGGLVSSASAVAASATLTSRGTMPLHVAANGAILASIASLLTDIPLVARIAKSKRLTVQIGWALGVVSLLGVLSLVVQTLLLAR